MSEGVRMFPIMDGRDIPWRAIEPHRAQAFKNHGQTLERLAERGGLSTEETMCTFEGRGLDFGKRMTLGDAERRLAKALESE